MGNVVPGGGEKIQPYRVSTNFPPVKVSVRFHGGYRPMATITTTATNSTRTRRTRDRGRLRAARHGHRPASLCRLWQGASDPGRTPRSACASARATALSMSACLRLCPSRVGFSELFRPPACPRSRIDPGQPRCHSPQHTPTEQHTTASRSSWQLSTSAVICAALARHLNRFNPHRSPR